MAYEYYDYRHSSDWRRYSYGGLLKVLKKNKKVFKEIKGKKNQTPFKIWLEKNIGVFDAFVYFAFEAKEAGKNKYGAQAIIERIRWWTDIEQTGDTDFSMDHNYNGYLSRLAMLVEPELKDFFETKVTNPKHKNHASRRKKK